MRLIIVIILLLLIYLLNKQNFIGGSTNNINEDNSNNIHKTRPKLDSEIKTQKQKEEATKKINNVTNSIDDTGKKFEKKYTKRKGFLAYYLSKKLDELEALMDKVAKPFKKD